MPTDKVTIEARGRKLMINRVFDATVELVFDKWLQLDVGVYTAEPAGDPAKSCPLRDVYGTGKLQLRISRAKLSESIRLEHSYMEGICYRLS